MALGDDHSTEACDVTFGLRTGARVVFAAGSTPRAGRTTDTGGSLAEGCLRDLSLTGARWQDTGLDRRNVWGERMSPGELLRHGQADVMDARLRRVSLLVGIDDARCLGADGRGVGPAEYESNCPQLAASALGVVGRSPDARRFTCVANSENWS